MPSALAQYARQMKKQELEDFCTKSASRRHRGAVAIQIQPAGRGRKLVGEYWTDRWSQGYMTLEDHAKEIVTDFAAARKVWP